MGDQSLSSLPPRPLSGCRCLEGSNRGLKDWLGEVVSGLRLLGPSMWPIELKSDLAETAYFITKLLLVPQGWQSGESHSGMVGIWLERQERPRRSSGV